MKYWLLETVTRQLPLGEWHSLKDLTSNKPKPTMEVIVGHFNPKASELKLISSNLVPRRQTVFVVKDVYRKGCFIHCDSLVVSIFMSAVFKKCISQLFFPITDSTREKWWKYQINWYLKATYWTQQAFQEIWAATQYQRWILKREMYFFLNNYLSDMRFFKGTKIFQSR